MQFESKWVLVTGASSGLGKEISRVLARDYRANLVLAARRPDRLEALSAELTREYKVEVKVIPADLARDEEVVRVFDTATREVPLYAAVLNAGVTHFGHHDELSWEAWREMLNLNVLSTSRMTMLMLPYLEQRKEQGGLMLVSGFSGLSPVPYQSAYAGTKAYLANLGASLHHEMWPRGVSVTTFAPGGIQSEMTEGDRFNSLRGWLMPAEQCAKSGLRSFKNRAYIAVPGFLYGAGVFVHKLAPQWLFTSVLASQYRKSLAANARSRATDPSKPARQGS